MTPSALVVTYHAIGAGRAPLWLDVDLLREHLDRVQATGAVVLTLRELAVALAGDALPERAVALTFDDAFASVAEHAAPLLAERGMRASVFVVAGSIGGTNAWPTQPPSAPRAPLAGLPQLRALADAGWEIGSHGTEHAPLSRVDRADARREVVESRAALEQALQVPVSSYALPYGDPPAPAARELLRCGYDAVCTTRLGFVTRTTDRWAIPRVDAHYVRRPAVLQGAIDGSARGYLRVRGVAARARRLVREDFVEAPA